MRIAQGQWMRTVGALGAILSGLTIGCAAPARPHPYTAQTADSRTAVPIAAHTAPADGQVITAAYGATIDKQINPRPSVVQAVEQQYLGPETPVPDDAAAPPSPGPDPLNAAHTGRASSAARTNSDKSSAEPPTVTINLPNALRLADASNPTIALASARVEEAYARLRQVEVAWLPDLRTGPTYQRHDGRIQSTIGDIEMTSKQSLFEHGDIVLSWNTSELMFAPLIAQQLTDAQIASSRAVMNNVQLDVALTYLELLRVKALLAINLETLGRAEEMLHNAEAAEAAQLGKTAADANRARTEVELRRQERFDLQGQAAIASAHLAKLLRLNPTVDLVPADPTIVPITLVPPDLGLDALVALGIRQRPELRSSQALVEAANARWREAKIAPLLPRVDVGYTGGTFGGGINDDMNRFGARSDGTAEAIWELHNLGAGDVANARVQRNLLNEASANSAEVETQIGEDVTVAAKAVRTRADSLVSSQRAIQQALETWRRLREASFGLASGHYDPLEPLIAERDLDQARVRYLNEVIEYNRAEFRLYWAMGQPPLCALPKAKELPLTVPVLPSSPKTAEPIPAGKPEKDDMPPHAAGVQLKVRASQ